MARDEDVDHRSDEHEQGEESEVIRAFEIHAHRFEFRNEEADDRRNLIPERDRQEPHRHENALHSVWRLGVGKFQSGDRHHHFARGKDDVGEELPADLRAAAVIDVELDHPDHDERERGEEQADPDLANRRERENTADRGIKPSS